MKICFYKSHEHVILKGNLKIKNVMNKMLFETCNPSYLQYCFGFASIGDEGREADLKHCIKLLLKKDLVTNTVWTERHSFMSGWWIQCKSFSQPGPPSVDTRIVDIFHASIDDASVKRIVNRMTATDGSLRILICTIAFGMGINCTDVRRIFHWGLSDSVKNYVQQIGRCRRDGHSGVALCYAYKCKKYLQKYGQGNDTGC